MGAIWNLEQIKFSSTKPLKFGHECAFITIHCFPIVICSQKYDYYRWKGKWIYNIWFGSCVGIAFDEGHYSCPKITKYNNFQCTNDTSLDIENNSSTIPKWHLLSWLLRRWVNTAHPCHCQKVNFFPPPSHTIFFDPQINYFGALLYLRRMHEEKEERTASDHPLGTVTHCQRLLPTWQIYPQKNSLCRNYDSSVYVNIEFHGRSLVFKHLCLCFHCWCTLEHR